MVLSTALDCLCTVNRAGSWILHDIVLKWSVVGWWVKCPIDGYFMI